jgi:hypothetical protein
MLNQDIHEAVLEFESDELDARDPLRSKMRPNRCRRISRGVDDCRAALG